MTIAHLLPSGVTVFERGWLSSNNVLAIGEHQVTLVDSGYVSHATQTLSLVQKALAGRELDQLINTHLHSDHCGGNALLQHTFKALQTHIPAGNASAVTAWNQEQLTYKATGQRCDQFSYTHTLIPGATMLLGDHVWEVHAAPGHDADSVVLFEPTTRTLISADALWQNGFGVVFPELEGIDAFDAVANSLDLCEALRPNLVIPGHGAPFTDVEDAIRRARNRLQYLRQGQPPVNHCVYAAKVLLKFYLLEHQRVPTANATAWLTAMPYFENLRPILAQHLATKDQLPEPASADQIANWLVAALCKSSAARMDGDHLVNM